MALVTMTILSTAVAATTSVMAWRVIRREARRSDARVAALAAAIHDPQPAVSRETANAMASFPSEYLLDVAPTRPRVSLTGPRLVATLTAAALVLLAALLIPAVSTQRGEHGLKDRGATVANMTAAAHPAQSSAPTAAGAPLELIALSHERGKDTLVVRGAIRNPSNGTTCEVPAVVVLTFDEHGIFLASSESKATGERLSPGAQASFSVSVPAGTNLPARYRVSFRNAGHLVPHVDKRVPVATGTSRPSDAANARQEPPVRL